MNARPEQTALITGASSGIGLELAMLFAKDRYDLLLVARREDKLVQLATRLRQANGIRVDVFAADLAAPGSAQAVFEQAEQRGFTIDVLVNNAGFGTLGPFAEADTAQQLDMLRLNVLALTHLTHLFLPGMLERNRGGVLNVASTAGFQAGPYMAVYYATKAYVISFSEALAEELRGTGVTATCLAPGPTATEFGERSGIAQSRLFRWGGAMSASMVAEAGYRAFQKRKTLVVPGMMNKLGVWAVRATPRRLVRKTVSWLQKTN